VSHPGLVTHHSALAAKLAPYWRLFANRQRAYRQMGFTTIAESRDRP
jgi:hypothetical protein